MNYKFIIIICLFFTSCATIISTSKQTVNFSSSPSDAKVYLNDELVGNTPLMRILERKNEYAVKIELEGYQTYETKLSRKLNGWFFGNIFLGGIIGIIVDASTGAMYQLTPEQISAVLTEKNGSTVAVKDKNLYIMASLEVDPSWKKIDEMKKTE